MKTKPLLVALVGGSGSGKSWLARKLGARLGGAAVPLALDDFYLDQARVPMARRARLNFDHPRAIDWVAFERVLRACRAGQSVRVPVYDFASHSRRAASRVLRPRPIILVEGLWLLHRARLRRLFQVSIFLKCGGKTRLRRRLARDLLSRGRSAESIREQFRRTVAPMHRKFVEPQAGWAQIVLRRPPTARRVRALAEQLRKQANMILSKP